MAQKAKTKENSYIIYDDHTVGTVQIEDEVIATIAALAATEVEGVASLGGGITHAKAARAGARALSRGVKIEIEDRVISVRMIVNMKYGYNIPDTTVKVQEKVKTALENMTGLEVSGVNVSVADVTIESK
ncbi:MAG: Asp23/Gls24 family envelope stress response protein [Eubacterium sp.]|nr:Asp23/Gls24 family envelope stress response protein [Eubacterium sp.]